jgi:hypothetical protein
VDAGICAVARCVHSQVLQKGLIIAVTLLGRINDDMFKTWIQRRDKSLLVAGSVRPFAWVLEFTPLWLVALVAVVAAKVAVKCNRFL